MTSESISSARVRHRLLYWAAVAVALLSCTLLTYSEIGRFLFSGTLLLKTVRLSFPSMIAVTLLLLVAPLSLLRRTRGSPFHVTVAASVALWLVCGRAVGLSWDGEFRSGWFFCATHNAVVLARPSPRSRRLSCGLELPTSSPLDHRAPPEPPSTPAHSRGPFSDVLHSRFAQSIRLHHQVVIPQIASPRLRLGI